MGAGMWITGWTCLSKRSSQVMMRKTTRNDESDVVSNSALLFPLVFLLTRIAAASKKAKAAQAAKLASQRAKDEAYAAKSITDYRPVVSADKEQDFMSSLLGQLDATPSTSARSAPPTKRKLAPAFASSSASRPFKPPTVTRPLKRKPSPARDINHFRSSEAPSSDPPSDGAFVNLSDGDLDDGTSGNDVSENEWIGASPMKKAKMEPSSSPIRALSELAVEDGDEYDDDADDGFWEEVDEMEFDEDVKGKVKGKGKTVLSVLPNGLPAKPEPKPEPVDIKPPSWLSLHASLKASTVTEPETLGSDKPGTASSNVEALENDGSLKMFWLDYLELEDKLYLVGKVLDKAKSTEKVKKWASCCVAIEGIERNLFVLPRKHLMGEFSAVTVFSAALVINLGVVEGGNEQDVAPTEEDVYEEFDHIRQKHGIKRWAAKFVPRKYAFGEVGITEGEAQWMKVVYGYNGMSKSHTICSVSGVLILDRDRYRACAAVGLVGCDV